MKSCIKCGGHAFNLAAHGIDQGDLCDVHYWQERAARAEQKLTAESAAYYKGFNDGYLEAKHESYSEVKHESFRSMGEES